MPEKTNRKVAIVIGDSDAIAIKIAKNLTVCHGISVIVYYAKSKDSAQVVIGLITQNGDACSFVADMANPSEIGLLF